MKLIVNQAYENMGLASTQTLGPILDGLMRNTPEARALIERAEAEGVRAVVEERDGPFGDYSQGERPDPRNVIEPERSVLAVDVRPRHPRRQHPRPLRVEHAARRVLDARRGGRHPRSRSRQQLLAPLPRPRQRREQHVAGADRVAHLGHARRRRPTRRLPSKQTAAPAASAVTTAARAPWRSSASAAASARGRASGPLATDAPPPPSPSAPSASARFGVTRSGAASSARSSVEPAASTTARAPAARAISTSRP